ncbi:glutamine--fructose-6-phosphate transaminase [Nitrosospira multiformis ATCC 25196]|uniref:Glutamine--fructose-6-phosphate aminotransferase [isomerizing] n=1 Tax=Nitrosospira multiformis (strain ATCC 25196 / NCIMB 11849 / C 71) TaxID=323848 RepID=Q2YCA0_NITMU|nr:glutamine--fructose-6-phosphate transaminase (isomerizing) [Nitrosospira multiformis]ABB73621.1 glutamine--fructose-6-phosphate transaminase [Nitrosospira multiformis ATCC 25196]SEF39030.1 glutamine--fructose-6-phosphate transaminase [Nitrosospira multiformis ATCC 25196]
MCGIVGAVAKTNIVPTLIEGLRRLEYRGYDSAGIALNNGRLHRLRTTGRVAELSKLADEQHFTGDVGIAHTRWATHGAPSERNAHPHFSGETPKVAVVHNGIIENHEVLRQRLQKTGFEFSSETDTEVIAHLISSHLRENPDLFEAVCRSVGELRGAYAIAVMEEARPERLIVCRNGAPLLLGLGENGIYAASDASALLQVTRRMIYLEEGDVAELRQDGYRIVNCRYDGARAEVARAVQESELTNEAVEMGPYAHFMQKEIFEQPGVVANTLEMVLNAQSISPRLFGTEAENIFKNTRSILILACGTSYHAGVVARYWLETVAGIPCNVEIASEYRYRNPAVGADTLIVGISQSGETADTLAALSYAKSLGHRYSLGICNVAESALVRQTDLRFLTRAGPEIGVASTKAFTTQLAALMLLTMTLAKLNGKLSGESERQMIAALRHLPVALQHSLQVEPQVKAWAERFAEKRHALFLGRGMHYPIALEGALKLKEISYIHAEAYAAGELKHGPLALVDKDMPVVAIAPNDALLEKLKSNLQEVRARGGELYVFADADSHIQESEGVHIIRLAEHAGMLSPILHTIPLQLLAYHVALQKGTDVDKPRNLAKSVTVE